MTLEHGWSACWPNALQRTLVSLVVGDEQKLALHQACQAALAATAGELRLPNAAGADAVAMEVASVFRTPALV